MTPKVINALVCEDVRIERNGKHIIIGVFTGAIVPSEIPATLSLTFWLQFGEMGASETKFEFRGTLSGKDSFGGNMIVSMNSQNDREASDVATVILGPIVVDLHGEGDLKLDIRFVGERWKNAVAVPVYVRTTDSPPPN